MRLAFDKAQRELKDREPTETEIFDYKNFKSLDKAFGKIDELIKEYKGKTKTAFILVVHSYLSIKRLASMGLSTLDGEAPSVYKAINREENEYPALDWSFYAAGHFATNCLFLDEWFEEKLNFSNYSGIPIGNLQSDSTSQIVLMIDVLFSRALQNSNSLLWYSDTSLPDLGGNEDADFRRFLYDQFESNIEISNPGFYRSYCVEIDLNLLCINAILQSDSIYEFVTTSSDQKITNQQKEFLDLYNRLSEDIESLDSCSSSFLKLKAVAQQWIEDIKKGNTFADILLQNLYFYLSSPNSKLYDPQLMNFVSNLMRI
jgi:DNA polymerase epsilon subunit 1